MNDKSKNSIKDLTENLLTNIGEDPKREGLIRTPHRVAKAWEYFSEGYRLQLDDIINNAVFNEDCSETIFFNLIDLVLIN